MAATFLLYLQKLLSSKTFKAGKDITFRDKHKTQLTNKKLLDLKI